MANPVDGGRSASGPAQQDGSARLGRWPRQAGRATRTADRVRGRKRHQVAVEWLVVVVVALVAALLVKTFVVQAFFIPSGSMEPTLVPGDRVLGEQAVLRLPRRARWRRCCVPPPAQGQLDSRRPDQTGHSRARAVVVGLQLQGLRQRQSRSLSPTSRRAGKNPGSEYCTLWDIPGMLQLPNPYRVPAGTYFVMGDNRKDSDDSRYWGPVPASYLVGRAFVRMWPPGRLGFL